MQQISRNLGFSQAPGSNIVFYQLCQITTHVSGKHQGVVWCLWTGWTCEMLHNVVIPELYIHALFVLGDCLGSFLDALSNPWTCSEAVLTASVSDGALTLHRPTKVCYINMGRTRLIKPQTHKRTGDFKWIVPWLCKCLACCNLCHYMQVFAPVECSPSILRTHSAVNNLPKVHHPKTLLWACIFHHWEAHLLCDFWIL